MSFLFIYNLISFLFYLVTIIGIGHNVGSQLKNFELSENNFNFSKKTKKKHATYSHAHALFSIIYPLKYITHAYTTESVMKVIVFIAL